MFENKGCLFYVYGCVKQKILLPKKINSNCSNSLDVYKKTSKSIELEVGKPSKSKSTMKIK